MQAPLQPLLVRPPLLPRETLPSFLARISQSNYESSGYMVDLVLGTLDPRRHHKYVKDRFDYPFKAETYNRIATLTMLDPLTLYQSTYHRFAPILTPPPYSVNHLILSSEVSVPCLPKGREQPQFRPRNMCQFCPKCLKERSYHPLDWIPIASSACLSHKCLLVDQCPNCQKKISLRAVIKAKCQACQFDLTKAAFISIANDGIGLRAQHLLQSWFMEYLTPASEISYLPQQPPAILYRIIEGIRYCIEAAKHSHWPYLHRLSDLHNPSLIFQKDQQIPAPYESYCVHTTAFKAIMRWPESFFEFLDNFDKEAEDQLQSARSDTITGDKVLKRYPQEHLGILYTQWIKERWAYPEFRFLKEIIDRYIAGNYWSRRSSVDTRSNKKASGPADLAKYISTTVAADMLHTSPEVIKLLQRNKLLALKIEDGHELLNRQEVLSWSKAWNDLVTAEKAGRLASVKSTIIRELDYFGIITKEQPSKKNPGRYYKISDVMVCLERFTRHEKNYSFQDFLERDEWISLTKAEDILFYKHSFQGVTLLLQILNGNLTAYHPFQGEFKLKSLLFDPFDFQKCLEGLKKQQSTWLEYQEVLRLLGIKDSTLQKWVKRQRILPIAMYKVSRYFDAETIYRLCSRYISQKEAAHILRISIPTLQNWIRAKQVNELFIDDPSLEEKDAHIFDKEQLMKWRDYRFTSAEATQALDISKSKLYAWVRAGKILPLEIVSGNEYWFLKEDIMKLKSRV